MQMHLAFVTGNETRQDVQQGGFTRAAGARDRQGLSGIQRQAQVVQNLDRPVAVRETFTHAPGRYNF